MSERGKTDGAEMNGLTILTRSAARKAKAEREGGYLFPLRVTGGAARVRIPNMTDRALIQRLPRELQETLAQQLVDQQQGGRKIKTVEEALEMLVTAPGEYQRLADELCKAGFVEPRLVTSEAELDPADPYCVLIEDIHPEDRLEFCEIVLGGEREAARRLRPFRAGSLDALPDQPGHETTAAAVTPAAAGT